ncbi:MAG: M48 family metalloprotease [Halobacteriovoraceae bacterium]|nr:M48 family metalloprotease [Halobacteriovoraceae bacterium]
MNDPEILLEKELRILMKTTHGRRAFLMAMPMLIAACSSSSKHRLREGDNTGQKTEMTYDDERKMTQEYLPKMSQEYPAHNDQEVQRYINSIGQKIVASSGLNNNPYTYNFTVVQTNQVNAFALPAGTVFVTAPLIKMASTEAELAGVIGHEIGHVQARHTAERIEKSKSETKNSILYGLGGAILGGAAGFGLGKLICNKQDRECLARAAKYGALAGAGGGLLIQKFGFMANSREDEMEADRIGFKTAWNAGYHKDYVGGFYTKLYEMEKKHSKGNNKLLASFADALSTHPPGEDRVTQMKQMSNQYPLKGKKVSSNRFDEIKKRL